MPKAIVSLRFDSFLHSNNSSWVRNVQKGNRTQATSKKQRNKLYEIDPVAFIVLKHLLFIRLKWSVLLVVIGEFNSLANVWWESECVCVCEWQCIQEIIMCKKFNENILIIGSYISGQLQLMIRLLLRLLNTHSLRYATDWAVISTLGAESSHSRCRVVVVDVGGWIILVQWRTLMLCVVRRWRRSMTLSGAIIIYAVKQLIVGSMNVD